MTNLFQVRPVFTGGQGMPGTNTLYGSEGDVAVADMRSELETFYGVWADSFMANDVTVTIPDNGDVIDSNTGDLIGVWTDGDPIAITGTVASDRLAFATQLLVQLFTSDIVAGRRLHGRIFLPGVTRDGAGDGVPASTTVTTMSAAAETCFADDFAVYSPTHHTWATVQSARVWDQYAVLRSRRD